ncbi:MAG: peptidylprolyl isomerase, partial [Planctomycetota bacterium]
PLELPAQAPPSRPPSSSPSKPPLPDPPDLPDLPLDERLLELSTGNDAVLARVAGAAIQKRHVYDRLVELEPIRVAQALELLTLDARLRVLARRAGVFVPPDHLDFELKRLWAKIRRKHAQSPGNLDFATYVEKRHGMEPTALRQTLRRLTARRLLRSYTLRCWLRQRGSRELHYFECDDRQTAELCRRQIAEGADFELVARQSSRHRSASRGGRLPPVPLDAEAFRRFQGLEPGELSKVTVIEGPAGARSFGFARLLRRTEPDRRPFAEQAAEIRKDLDRRPVQAFEFALLRSDL